MLFRRWVSTHFAARERDESVAQNMKREKLCHVVLIEGIMDMCILNYELLFGCHLALPLAPSVISCLPAILAFLSMCCFLLISRCYYRFSFLRSFLASRRHIKYFNKKRTTTKKKQLKAKASGGMGHDGMAKTMQKNHIWKIMEHDSEGKRSRRRKCAHVFPLWMNNF